MTSQKNDNLSQERLRNSRKQIQLLENICQNVSGLSGIPATLLNRRGHIVFRTTTPLTMQSLQVLTQLRRWFFRELRKLTGENRPPAPGPIVFALEADRVWAVISMKASVWSQDLLFLGPLRQEQAEEALEYVTRIICYSFHNKKTHLTLWQNPQISNKAVKARLLRNSIKADLPASNPIDRLLQAMETGDSTRVEKAKANFIIAWQKLATRPLRAQKNEALLLAQQLTMSAQDSSLDLELAYGILDDHLSFIETCRSSEQVLDWLLGLADELSLQIRERHQQAWSQPTRLCQHYINKRLYSKISLDDLASYTGHNPSYLSRHFKDETGEAITEYITRKKIEAACTLLTTYKKSIQDVSIMLAFSDQAHFTRSFRQYTGTTPLKFVKGEADNN